MIGIIGATGQVGKEVAIRDFDFLRPDTFATALKWLSQVFLVVDRGDNLDLFLSEAQNQRLALVRRQKDISDGITT